VQGTSSIPAHCTSRSTRETIRSIESILEARPTLESGMSCTKIFKYFGKGLQRDASVWPPPAKSVLIRVLSMGRMFSAYEIAVILAIYAGQDSS
jgi:hypothetical protein